MGVAYGASLAGSGATVPATLIRYTHKGTVHPQGQLIAGGVRRVKQVFRYDFSPLFARLDDAVKQIPVLDRETHRMRLTEAPRCYRFPVRVAVKCGARQLDEEVTVVLRKGGLDRLERETLP